MNDADFYNLEGRMDKLERQLQEHDAALRGNYNGKLGLLPMVEQVIQQQAVILAQQTQHSDQLESFRLDRAKILGITTAVTFLCGICYKLFLAH